LDSVELLTDSFTWQMMENPEIFVLANGVRFIPVGTMHERAKHNFDHDEEDVVLTHQHTRKSSKVIHADGAALLKEFETPRTWAEVILNFSRVNKKDPQLVAEEAIELLMEMKAQGFIIPFEEGGSEKQDPLFKAGDPFKNYIIKERLQYFEDSEVYRIEDEPGKSYALKLLKTKDENKISFMFNNEIEILRKLDGKINPWLIDEGVEPGFAFLIVEWIAGIGAEAKAKRLQNLGIRSNMAAMLDLCIAIVNAYDHLHKQGIFHSDIYPKNILVSEYGQCKIIDFGISITIEGEKKKFRGGGMCYYFEPELAITALENKISPPSTAKAEQYSIAAVLYFLITGHHYLNFSIERDRLFAQIAYDTPNPMAAYDLDLPKELDEVFAIALSKDPAKRFPTLKEFAGAITAIRSNLYANPSFFIAGKENAPERFINFVLGKFGWDSSFIQKGLALSPASSVNYGAAGIAYMFYRIACVKGDPQMLELADVWSNRAAQYEGDEDHSFFSPELGFSPKSIGKRSLYHSPAGVHLVGALIDQCRGDQYSLSNSLKKFVASAMVDCDKTDLALGRAGLLVGAAILVNELGRTQEHQLKGIKEFANKIMFEIWNELDRYPSLKLPNEVNFFGMAHGWAGLLYGTLLWCHHAKQPLPSNFIMRLEELQSSALPEKGSLVWPLSVLDKHSWTGWCNGSAGYVFLWSLLYKHFGEEMYLAMAEQIAGNIIAGNSRNISNLCCGFAGEAYALLNLYNLTADPKYLVGAQDKQERIMTQIAEPVIRNNSLYKGDIGLALLFTEMTNPSQARMPLFETGGN
jgi:eukaryotic-like serine/threonine-protein kinase